MKRIILTMTVFLALTITVFAQETDPKLDVIDLIKNIDLINIALVVAFMFAGGFMIKARIKLKQISELFAMAYEFTDDKVLDKKERQELISQFLLILGKKKAEQIQTISRNKFRNSRKGER